MILLPAYRSLFVKRPKHRYYFITGGRGSAKSFHVATFLLNLTYEAGHVILFTRYTMVAANISIIPEFIEKIELLGKHGDFQVTQGEITNVHTGSRILFKGIKNSSGNQTANLKSIQGVTTWVLDEAEELTDEATFDRIDLSIRHKTLPNRVVVVMNPSHKGHFLHNKFATAERNDTIRIHTTWTDNRENLSESFITLAENTAVTNAKRYGHIFLGEWADDATGLLWTRPIIDRVRVTSHPELIRIVVAIDPAVTSKPESDETGIVVCGKDAIGNGYILDDLSGRYTPAEWASVAISASKRYKASIIAEVNQGGDMVTAVIRNQDPSIPIKQVRAVKGKYSRAEPVYALYEQNRIFHVGHFPVLEQQMVSFNPDEMQASPDRVDALVWGVSELITGKRQFFAV
jgi:phage terminase large subunit-like protein